MTWLKIENGTIVDPINQVDQVVGDLWIRDGKIVSEPETGVVSVSTIDATGQVVMPGGIDIHCHIAGPKVNSARKLFPQSAEGSNQWVGSDAVMTTDATGLRYAGLGYTTAFDAAVPALMSRHAHMELDDTPCIDSGLFVLAGNNHFVFECIRNRDSTLLKNFPGLAGRIEQSLRTETGQSRWRRKVEAGWLERSWRAQFGR